MPTYLVHGFRWPRAAIRIHIILFDLEDAAAEWIVAPASAITLLNSFYTLYDFLPPSQPPMGSAASSNVSSPRLAVPPLPNNGITNPRGRRSNDSGKIPPKFNDWSVVKLLEQYNPDDESCASQPYAYVADYMVPVVLSVDIGAEMAAYEERQRGDSQTLLSPTSPMPRPQTAPDSNGTNGNTASSLSERDLKRKSRRLGWFEKLRDQLAKEAEVGWYIVYCGDEDRSLPDLSELRIQVEEREEGERIARPKTPRSAGLRSMFGRRDRQPSRGPEPRQE